MIAGLVEGLHVPRRWGRVPLGRLASRQRACGRPDLQPLSVFLERGVVPRADLADQNHNRLGADLGAYLVVEPGDLVFNKLRTWQGGLGHSRHLGIVSPAYFVLRPAASEPRFLDYLLHSTPYLQELTRRSKWMPPSQFDIGWEELRALPILDPPLETQRRIADYLDDETSRIDGLIAAKQRMIHLAGLRMTADLNSSLECAGDRRAPLRRFVTSLTQGTSGQAGSTPAGPEDWGILKLSAVKSGRFHEAENKVVGPSFPIDPELRPVVGDLLVTRSNTPDYVGDTCAVRTETGQVLLPDLIYRIRLDERLNVAFASMALRTTSARLQLSSTARGTSQSMVKLRGEDILNVLVPVPSAADQQSIVASHDLVIAEVEALTGTLSHQISLLKERRQALITAAVTGGIEV